MTQDKFKDLIEVPIKTYNKKDFVDVRSTGIPMSETMFKVWSKALIARTVRLTLQYPELAKEYYDNLPKVVNESEQPKIS